MRTSALPINKALFQLLTSWADARSKDPKTKVGACVFDPLSGGMFLGYNGFPKGISDTEERWGPDNKYNYVIHAEENALIKALMGLGIRVRECELYVTLQPCHMCMRLIVQCGIKTVYYLNARPDPITAEMAREAGVTVSKFEVEKIDWPVSRGTSSSELLNLFAEGEKYGTTDRVSDR